MQNGTSDMKKYSHPIEKELTISNFVELARYRATHRDHNVAYTFLVDGILQEKNLSYRDLDRHARAIAAFLQDAGISGERALLVYPPGLDFICAFFGCLYAGVVAVPIYPPINRKMMSSVEPIIKDAATAAILTTTSIYAKLKMIKPLQSVSKKPFFKLLGKSIDKFVPQYKLFNSKNMHLISTDSIDLDFAEMWRQPAIGAETLAFLQYTSGSTSLPKGVMISHGNILHNQILIQDYFKLPKEFVVVSWLPQYHDMGLIGNIMQPFFLGGRCILISPFEFLRKPLTWLTAISKYKAHTSGAPNFGYELCVRKIGVEDRQRLDLASWQVAYCGAEPIRPETLDRFAEFFSDCGFQKTAFLPCYGLAEGTLIVTGAKRRQFPTYLSCDKNELKKDRIKPVDPDTPIGTTLVSSGSALDRQKVWVVEPEKHVQLSDNEIGEVWVSGLSVAQGYWSNPNDTRETFQAKLRDSNEGPFLRTGDLGFLRNGELFITGRIKDLIIIRGQNYYPNDLEYTAENSHSSLRKGCTAAISVEYSGEEKLAIVCEILQKVKKRELEDIVVAIDKAILENHGITTSRIVLIKAKTIPKTTSGKIRRKMCKLSLLNGKLDEVYQWYPAEGKEEPVESMNYVREDIATEEKAGREQNEEMYSWFLEIINKTSYDEITMENLPDKSLSDTGLDSIDLIDLLTIFEEKFDCKVNVDVDDFLQMNSLSEMFDSLASGAYKNNS